MNKSTIEKKKKKTVEETENAKCLNHQDIQGESWLTFIEWQLCRLTFHSIFIITMWDGITSFILQMKKKTLQDYVNHRKSHNFQVAQMRFQHNLAKVHMFSAQVKWVSWMRMYWESPLQHLPVLDDGTNLCSPSKNMVLLLHYMVLICL